MNILTVYAERVEKIGPAVGSSLFIEPIQYFR